MTPKTWKELMKEAVEDQKKQEEAKPTPQELLAMEIDSQDGKTYTLLQYLTELNSRLFAYPRGFDGAKPLGEDDWKVQDIAYSLIINGYIDGRYDGDGKVLDYNRIQYTERIHSVFDFLRNADPSSLQLPPEPKEWYLIEFDTTDPENPTLEGLYDSTAYTKEEAKSFERDRYEGAFGIYLTRKAVKLTL